MAGESNEATGGRGGEKRLPPQSAGSSHASWATHRNFNLFLAVALIGQRFRVQMMVA